MSNDKSLPIRSLLNLDWDNSTEQEKAMSIMCKQKSSQVRVGFAMGNLNLAVDGLTALGTDNNKPEMLWLSDCGGQFSVDKINLICKHLPSNIKLVDLSSNNWEGGLCTEEIDALKNLPDTVTGLGLGVSTIKDGHVDSILGLLKARPNITELCLEGYNRDIKKLAKYGALSAESGAKINEQLELNKIGGCTLFALSARTIVKSPACTFKDVELSHDITEKLANLEKNLGIKGANGEQGPWVQKLWRQQLNEASTDKAKVNSEVCKAIVSDASKNSRCL